MNRKDSKMILVTGGAGAIGGNLVKRLAMRNDKVIVIDDLSSGYRENVPKSKNIVFIKGNIVKNSDIKRAFSYDISIVFHLAANFANQNSIEHPRRDLLTNALGTLKVLEHSVKKHIKKFVYVSTSCIYGEAGTILKEELLDYKHDTPYSISKLMGEKYVLLFNEYYKLKACVLRYFNVYGPGESPGPYRNVIPNFFWRAMKGDPLPITGTGEETRDFTYVDDVVATTIKAAESEKADGQVFNVASGLETKVIGLAKKINTITKNKAGVIFVERRAWDKVLRRKADIEKASRILGHKVTVGLDEGLAKTYKWLKRNVKLK